MSASWSEAGFRRHEAETWRSAGWHDASAAASWMAASPADTPAHLRRLHDAGYSTEQLRQTGRFARRHVAAWTAAMLKPALAHDLDLTLDLR